MRRSFGLPRRAAVALLLAARVAPGDAACACDAAKCVDPEGYESWCAVAEDGDLKVVGDEIESSCSTAIVAAPNPYPTDTGCNSAGAAYVSKRVDGTWMEEAYLNAANGGAGDRFGRRVSISGTTLVVGAPSEKS